MDRRAFGLPSGRSEPHDMVWAPPGISDHLPLVLAAGMPMVNHYDYLRPQSIEPISLYVLRSAVGTSPRPR